ncbi:DUF169 domain-containing protein [Thermanaeromonas sp. C210]|uniref:DUF169 domain-containing protein n=1 Tax=Thermanaeromonas sp. C210 TaxID=2731925 RepID=UPI00155CDC39|nr:DUF169 domain-containing protein [Thermanaeromonas sp. C210]GFN23490.1 (4Fe-4S)-binding protein [Thermanaeromonas sp. C210]
MVAENKAKALKFKELLSLRWEPVAVRLLRRGEKVPEGLGEPHIRLRYCQAVVAARRGYSLLLAPKWHACPDGAAILGLIEMSPKLKSGELYLRFRKLPDLKVARRMIEERPVWEAGEYSAVAIAPLAQANFEPHVIIFTLWPEQAMWLCSADSYFTGERQIFETSSYNSVCAELTVRPVKTGRINTSFGCYGSRASSDMDDFETFLSIPAQRVDNVLSALEELARKAMAEERKKIYAPPVVGFGEAGEEADCQVQKTVTIMINKDKCQGDGNCVDFCPHGVLQLIPGERGRLVASAVRPDLCTACYTCVGQCPSRAITLVES